MNTLFSSSPYQKPRVQLLLFFGYRGDLFFGLQAQPGRLTVQSALEDRLNVAFGEVPRALQFAARTDRGVHAIHNVATCWSRELPDLAKVRQVLSADKNDGILYVKCFVVDRKVHARGSARAKFYRYVIETECEQVDASEIGAWQIAPWLDKKALETAGACLLGEHDFTSFRGGGCSSGTPIKRIERFSIKGPFISSRSRSKTYYIDIVANGFLRKMIRNLVGTLVEIGAGLKDPNDMRLILEAKDRAEAGLTAPPQGLTLMRVGFLWPTPEKSGLYGAQ